MTVGENFVSTFGLLHCKATKMKMTSLKLEGCRTPAGRKVADNFWRQLRFLLFQYLDLPKNISFYASVLKLLFFDARRAAKRKAGRCLTARSKTASFHLSGTAPFWTDCRLTNCKRQNGAILLKWNDAVWCLQSAGLQLVQNGTVPLSETASLWTDCRQL